MGGKAKAPPPPDYSGIAAASKEAAELSYKLGNKQLAWAKKQYASDKKITNKVVDNAIAQMNEQTANAREDRLRYEQVFQPLENELVEDAKRFSSDAYQDQQAGRAAADVSREMQLARTAAQDRLESFGIDPTQTRAGALDLSTRIAEATGRAGAAQTARDAAETKGIALRSEAVNIGRGMPGQIATQYGQALQAGQGAAGARLNQTASGANTMGTGLQWNSQGNQSLGTWSNALTQGYNAQMQQFNANQNASSGWGSALGLVGGIGMKMFGFEDGGMVPEDGPEQLAQGTSHQGVPIGPELSPSGGEVTDDVPARVNVGEFIVPTEAVSWFGEKHFQKLIEKAKEEKAKAGAKPSVSALPVQAPAVNTAREAALPLG